MPVSISSYSGRRCRDGRSPAPVLVGEGPLRILVQHLEIGVGRRGVEEVVQLLHVLAVVAFAVGQAEEPLLENRIVAVPQRQRETEALFVIGEAGDAVLAPAVGLAAGVIVRQVVPGRAVGAVVLANRAPLTLGEIGSPLPPGRVHPSLLEPRTFSSVATHQRLRLCRWIPGNNSDASTRPAGFRFPVGLSSFDRQHGPDAGPETFRSAHALQPSLNSAQERIVGGAPTVLPPSCHRRNSSSHAHPSLRRYLDPVALNAGPD